MDIKTFQEKSIRTMDKDLSREETLKLMALGLAGEAGEVVDHLKKYLYHGHEFDELGVIEEIGDVMFYLVNLCTAVGVDMEVVLDMNYSKLLKRFPEGFNEEDSRNRDAELK